MSGIVNSQLRPCTVKLIRQLLSPLVNIGVITATEFGLTISNLNHLAKHGSPTPAIQPKLITPQEVADMLGISYSQLRALEKENALPFKRKVVGSKTVRYSKQSVIDYILDNSDNNENYPG